MACCWINIELVGYHDHHRQPHDGDDGDLPSRPLRWLHRAAAIQQCLQALWAPASSKLAVHHLSLVTVTTCTFSLTSTSRQQCTIFTL